MLLNMPEELIPYASYDKEKILVHSEDMPEELKPLFREFLEEIKTFNEERRREMLDL